MKTDWNIKAKPVESALGVVQAAVTSVPKAAVVLGSGVAALVDLVDPVVLPFEEVFGIAPTIAGHAGSLTVGHLTKDKDAPLIAVLRGRFHLYEGHNWDTVTLPTKLMVEWGVPQLILTNAAGGLNRNFRVGDLMVLTGYRDMLNPAWKEKGLLPALMADSTDCRTDLSEQILRVGDQLTGQRTDFPALQRGVYAGLLGPCYETMAEIEMLRRLKADAVGMSTVPELQTAKGTKTQAAAISVVTNVWREDEPIGGHEEVLAASKAASLKLDLLFRALFV